MDRSYDNIIFISKYLRRPEVVNFADIIKIAIMLIKTTFNKGSVKVKI